MSKQASYQWFVGIDISARTVSVACGPDKEQIGKAQTFEQTPAGRKGIIKRLKASGHEPCATLVVIEATGTYWMQVAFALHEAGFIVSVVNPKHAHHYALAENRQAKTDAIDAQMLARMAAAMRPAAWQPPSEAYEALNQRLVERDQLVNMRQMIRNHLHALNQRVQVEPDVVARKNDLINHIDQQIKIIDQQLEALLEASEWAAIARQLRSIKGIGLLGAAWLLVITNGFTTCDSPEQLASYLAVVPHPNQSGTSRRGYRRTGRGGQARARRVLYQGSLSAVRFNPIIKPFYQRLIANGKPTRVARVAATRKLIHIAFALARKEQMFDMSHHKTHTQTLAA